MANKKGVGLLMVWADIPADKEEEFNRWFNEEHLGDILAIPGVLDGARYVAVKGAPKYLVSYELESVEVVENKAFEAFRVNPTEWSKRMSPRVIGTNFINNVYRQIYPSEVSTLVAQSDMAPTLHIGRMGVPAEIEDDFNEWYNTVHVPNFQEVQGCIRGRRYEAVRGEPKYMTVYELEHDMVSRGPEWDAARNLNPRSASFRPHMTHGPGSPGIFNKIFPL